MRRTLISMAGATAASASSLSSICSSSNVKGALPSIAGINYGDVTAASVYNASVEAGNNYPAVNGRNYCNVTVNYSLDGKTDSVSIISASYNVEEFADYPMIAGQRLVLSSGAIPIQRSIPCYRRWWLRHQLWFLRSRWRSRLRCCSRLHRWWHGLGN